jgi:hypothetical protein
MCGGGSWAEEPWRPTETLALDLDPALLPMRREADAIGFLPGVPLS